MYTNMSGILMARQAPPPQASLFQHSAHTHTYMHTYIHAYIHALGILMARQVPPPQASLFQQSAHWLRVE